MTKVCRLCLQKLQKGSPYFNVNAVESFTGFMPYRDQLTTCIPEIALDLIPNPVICNYCRTALKNAYEFKHRCLQVEEKIRAYVEQKINTSDFESDDQIVLEDIVDETERQKRNYNEQVCEEPPLEKPIVTIIKRNKPKNNNIAPDEQRDPIEIHPISPELKCDKCNKTFSKLDELSLHQAFHTEEYNCNFCNRSFKSLQYLRKHNTSCSKVKQEETGTIGNVLTKRPHLPAKAKNHLKHWLFRHTDHPYPTDKEKQVLMKETNLTLLQVENWFINARRRILQDLTKLKSHQKYQEFLDLHTEIDLDNNEEPQNAPSISKIKQESKKW